jgi:hypothetical protein
MIDLTRRQRDVLAKLQDLYRERGSPIHYRDLAERLGVNRFSAYDMLKVLESKGVVGSQYILSKVPGPGRPEVAFYPLAQAARQALARLSDGLDWDQVRERILLGLRQRGASDPDQISSLLDDAPRSVSPLVYCGRVFAALIMSLEQRAQVYGRQLLAASNPADRLDLFAGLVFGLTLLSSSGRQISQQVVESTERCRQYIEDMDAATRDDLANFVQQVVALRST